MPIEKQEEVMLIEVS